jgi:hypothetical protein
MEATHMKILGIISTATLFLLLGTAVTTVAQDEHHDDGAKPAQREEQAKPAKQEQTKPEQREVQPKPAKQETQKQPAQHEQQAKPAKQQPQAKPEQRQEQAKSTKQGEQHQAKATQQENRQQANNRQPQRSAADEQRQRSQPALRLSARGEGRIPDDRFRSNFGRGHEFRIGTPRLVDGYSRFQYGGYWFGFVQPWPVGWYYTDDVYVDYINGQYYLCNPSYPGTQIVISVVL